MHITEASTHPSVNIWSRTLAHGAFQVHALFLEYLRWLDQSYGATVTCTFHADRSLTIGMHGVAQLTMMETQGRIRVRWLQPEPSYWPVLHGALSKPEDLTQAADGWWQFYMDTRHDSYLLRDLISHLHH